jgi:hypothetical protein
MEPPAVKVLAALILGVLISVAGVLVGAWWAPFTVGIAFGIVEPRARFAVPAGALIGLAGWGLPLAAAQVRFGLGPTAGTLATIMGFAHQPAIPLALTCIVGLLLGLTGAWLGSATRSLVASNAPVDAERTE